MANKSGVIETRVVWKEAFQVVGEKIRFDPSINVPPSSNEIAHLWPRFSERVKEISHVKGGGYGFNLSGPNSVPGEPFDYLAAVEVFCEENVPEGMTAVSFPAGLYCVVTRKGVIDEIGGAFRYFREEWLPDSGFACRESAAFEYYDERYHGNHDPESVMDLWFPVRPARSIPIENRVASVFVHVTDLRRSAEWYSRLLGLPVLEERLNEGPVYWFDLPGTTLILDSNSANRQNPDWREEMKPRFMFPTNDIDEAYSYIAEKGEPYFEPERHGSIAFFNFRDPEGNALMACWSKHPGEETDITGSSPILPRIGGVFVDVKNMQATARWYTELLGLPLDERTAQQSVYAVPVTRGASLLLDQNRYLNQESFTELFYFMTEDLEATLQFVRNQGFQLAGEPNDFPDLSEVSLLDPDGNRILIVQFHSKGA